MKKCIVIMLLCISLASCINIESDITIKNDGSGIIVLTYTVSPLVRELGRIGDEVRSLPLPIYKEDFENLLLLYPGLTLKSHSVKVIDGESRVKATLLFQNVQALTPFGGGDEDPFFFEKSGDYTIFRQNLPFGDVDKLDEDMNAMLTEYCSGHSFIYCIHTPDPIIEYSHGEISNDKKHVVYKTGIIDVLKSKKGQSIEVKW